MKKKKNNVGKHLIQQSNALVESSQALTTVERRLIYHILSRINPEVKQKDYILRVSDFLNDFPNMNEKSIYSQLKDGVQRLYKRDIQMITERGSTRVFGWLQEQEYKDSEGFLRVKFSDSMMPLIFELKEKYTTMILENFKLLDSAYSLKLYELLCQYRRTGMRTDSVEDLKFLLSCEDKYPEFKDLRKKVINPAIQEINAKSDLLIHSIEFKKTGRKITHIVFGFSEKDEIETLEEVEVKTKPKKDKLSLARHPNPKDEKKYGDLMRFKRSYETEKKSVFEYDKWISWKDDMLKNHYSNPDMQRFFVDVFRWAVDNVTRINAYEKTNKLNDKRVKQKATCQKNISMIYSTYGSDPVLIAELDKIKAKFTK